MTDDELEAIRLTAELANVLATIVLHGPTREADLAELCSHIHAIQHAIMSQKTAREYPEMFRTMGGIIGTRTIDIYEETIDNHPMFG